MQKRFSIIFFFMMVTIGAAGQQVADESFNHEIKNPVYPRGKGSAITLDEAHFNFHTLKGRYAAFGRVLQNDGYVLKSSSLPFTGSSLAGTKILVIANALPDTMEWKLPTKPAFTKEEVTALHKWVSDGGSLFLIADHMPFPGAVAPVAESFGFNLINGFAFKKDKKPEFFSRKGGTLTVNVITNGRTSDERIDSIKVFTGEAFIPPPGATIISRLDNNYQVLMPTVAWEFDDKTPSISGQNLVNGAFMEYGNGRIVVMGEAAMFSAQISAQKNRMGMNDPDAKQNPQFLLNIIHWLDKKL
ncbi:MAG: DUF4350 domain-containing protein [Bacteroidetes bacterium]|nr:DUF4350 domain-containing protein [Bacteroidota bacterium]